MREVDDQSEEQRKVGRFNQALVMQTEAGARSRLVGQ